MFNKQQFNKGLTVIAYKRAMLIGKRMNLHKLPLLKQLFLALLVSNFFKQISDNPMHPYENSICHFTCEKHAFGTFLHMKFTFHIRNRHFCTFEIRILYVK